MTSAAPDKPRLGSKHKILLRVERFSRRHYVVVFIMAALAMSISSVTVVTNSLRLYRTKIK